jgi:Putative auto-transporter adhesin, head GIN domain
MMSKSLCFGLILLGVLVAGCGPVVEGSGKIVTETRSVAGFSAVSLGGSGRLVIERGSPESLSITADDNLMQYIGSEVRGRTLALEQKDNVNLSPSKDIVFRLTVKDLDNIDISGSGSADAKGLQGDKLMVGVSGSGEISLEGTVNDLAVDISGSGQYHGRGMSSKRARVDISGSGGALLAVSEQLDATVSGSGSIEYIGNPQVRQDISGSGSIRKTR